MAALPYKSVSWGVEPISKDKLNQMANNDQWLFENTPRMMYNARGVKKTSGVKILAGIALAPASKTTVTSVAVYFGSFFSQGCTPVVVATPVHASGRTRMHTIVKGIGTGYPDHRGVTLVVTADEYNSAVNNFPYGMAFNYIAVGW